jgi:hypothetical protein
LLSRMAMQVTVGQDPPLVVHMSNELLCIEYSRMQMDVWTDPPSVQVNS